MGEGEACRDDPPPSGAGPGAVLAAGAVALVLGVLGALLVDRSHSWGWDESMHAELPAARIALALRAGAPGEVADAVLECQQYPFAYPLYLAAWQVALGVSEGVARVSARVLWGVGLFGVFLLGRELARGAPRRVATAAPWVALGLGALSPLGWSYSGTLFLEAPFTVATTFALWAWLRRDGSARRELFAGALAITAFFTRFNQGGLLGIGLLLALCFEVPAELRAGTLGAWLRRTAWLAAVPALALAWWFLLPLPQGLERAAEHRTALLDFLGGNLQLGATPWNERALHLGLHFAPSPAFLVMLLLGLFASVPRWLQPRARVLALVLLGLFVPMALHPFHLDRFLLPLGPALWVLAALGLSVLWGTVRGAVVCSLILVGTSFALRGDLFFDVLYGFHDDPLIRAIQDRTLAEWRSLSPAKAIPTAGYPCEEADGFLDLTAGAAGPDGRVAWLGIQSELSPAAIHLGLLARGGSAERFRRDAHLVRPDGQPEMCIAFSDEDPGWSGDVVRGWASGFDVVMTTQPIQIKRSDRAFLDAYQIQLVESGEWVYEIVGEVTVARGARAPQAVKVIACKPAAQ